MDGILANAGEYRTKGARPAGSIFEYIQPDAIPQEVEKICRQRGCQLKRSKSTLERIKIAANLLSGFLHTHPFSNGNGRTARVILNAILLIDFSIPVSLFRTKGSSEIYLACLEEARFANDRGPLARFILENVFSSLHLACSSLDILAED